ncbi:MAG: OmpA family protein, partial [Hyphomonas sp.]
YRNTYSADFISLGCHGVLVTQFTDNALVDVDGVDLYIFEVGPMVEKTELAISSDGENWIDVGVIEGARADVDIGPFVNKGDRFYFVRLTNASDACGGNHSGADIDAIAAVGAEIRLSLDSALLFDVGKFDIKPEAATSLEDLAAQIAAYGPDIRITVEGHTDSTGSAAANQTLSENRADSVWTFLAGQMSPVPEDVTIRGYGASRPVADNATEEGRAENRRVDILILPGRQGYLKE